MASITLESVGKTYPGGVKAVHSVDLEVADGQFLVLVGPSGCGKSTLLRMIAGLEKITAGTIRIGDKVVNDMEPADRDIAMVFQNYALYPHMKVYDNMAYGLRNRRTPKDEIDRRVREAAATLELSHLLDRRPRELSGGQRQRVAMGRAIVRKPKAFLFDEPLSNLDAKLRGQMRVQIKNLQRSLGVTSVYVTHDQLEAMTMADVLVVMNAGNVEQAGSPLEVYEKPGSTFVASFIGAPSMNLIALEGQDALAGAAAPGGAVTLGFRPEDAKGVEPGEAAAGAGQLSLSAVVEGVEPVGAESFLYCKAAGTTVVLRVAGRTALEPGDALTVHADRAKLHWFDKAGKRIGD